MQSSVKEAESKGTRNGERKRCWQHLKLSWESCATASYLHHYWPPLSLSVACVSVRLQASQSGSVTLCCFSSWLLLFSIPPSVPLLLGLLSYIFTPPPFFIPLPSFSSFIFFRVCLFFTRVELPTVGLILLLPTTSSFHPTLLLLIGTEGG